MSDVHAMAEVARGKIEIDDERIWAALAEAITASALESIDVGEAVADGVRRAIDAFDDDDYEFLVDALTERLAEQVAVQARDMAFAELRGMASWAREEAERTKQ